MFKPDERVLDALLDYKFLLNRGYRRQQALRIIEERYRLTRVEKVFLYRSVFSDEDIRNRLAKKVLLNSIRNSKILVDGFNVLTVIRSAIRGETLIICEDTFVRDLSSAFQKIKLDDNYYRALEIFLSDLKDLSLTENNTILIVYDAPVSRSGILAGYTRELMKNHGIQGTALTVQKADKTVIEESGVIVSGDSYIISRALKICDIGGIIALRHASAKENIISIRRLIRERLKEFDAKTLSEGVKKIIKAPGNRDKRARERKRGQDYTK